jgi:hypothetical protein
MTYPTAHPTPKTIVKIQNAQGSVFELAPRAYQDAAIFAELLHAADVEHDPEAEEAIYLLAAVQSNPDVGYWMTTKVKAVLS